MRDLEKDLFDDEQNDAPSPGDTTSNNDVIRKNTAPSAPARKRVEARERTRVGRSILFPRRELIDLEQRIRDERQSVRRPPREEEMESGFGLVTGDRNLRPQVGAPHWLLGPLLGPTEPKNQLGKVAAPARAIGVGCVLLQRRVQFSREVLGATLVPRRDVERIRNPPDARIGGFALGARHLPVGAA